ncbi:MAG: Rhs-family protein, partial [Candidatus Peregrinibacteria bacterium GW2011_GWA2_33_10]
IAGTSSVAKNWASMFGSREVNALSPMRLRVMDNVTASKFARAETGYPVLEAKIDQISHGYSADTWEMTTLRAGDVVYGGIPGQSAFYTDFETALGAAGNKEVLGENLQIQPHPIRGYRSNIAAYKVVNDARIPSSVVHANPQFGVGGGRQFFIDHYSCALRLENEFNLEEFYNENQLPTNRFRP